MHESAKIKKMINRTVNQNINEEKYRYGIQFYFCQFINDEVNEVRMFEKRQEFYV